MNEMSQDRSLTITAFVPLDKSLQIIHSSVYPRKLQISLPVFLKRNQKSSKVSSLVSIHRKEIKALNKAISSEDFVL